MRPSDMGRTFMGRAFMGRAFMRRAFMGRALCVSYSFNSDGRLGSAKRSMPNLISARVTTLTRSWSGGQAEFAVRWSEELETTELLMSAAVHDGK